MDQGRSHPTPKIAPYYSFPSYAVPRGTLKIVTFFTDYVKAEAGLVLRSCGI